MVVGILCATGRGLPLHRCLCYKRYMRKWMGDRLKRRKKGGEGAKDSAKANAPEPLQPKYFESEISGKPVSSEAAPEVESQAATPERPEPERSVPQRSHVPRAVARQESAMEPAGSEKETQADFLLASRGAPELPLAAAVSGESRSRSQNQNQVRPARRRRKRGGRGGGARRAPGAGPAGAARGGSAPGGIAPVEAGEESAAGAEHAGFGGPLTPESAGDEVTPVAATGAAPPSSSSREGVGASAPAVAGRPSKGTVVLAIGLPGSGKSSWFKRHDIHPLSSDLLRELLFDDAQEQRFQDLVFSNLRSMLKARLIARRPMNYVDATNLTPHDRHSWIKLAKDYGYDVQGLFFDVPLEVCLERHARRGRAVPEEIMRKMAGKLKPPTFEEGFSKITVVRVKQKDAAAG